MAESIVQLEQDLKNLLGLSSVRPTDPSRNQPAGASASQKSTESVATSLPKPPKNQKKNSKPPKPKDAPVERPETQQDCKPKNVPKQQTIDGTAVGYASRPEGDKISSKKKNPKPPKPKDAPVERPETQKDCKNVPKQQNIDGTAVGYASRPEGDKKQAQSSRVFTKSTAPNESGRQASAPFKDTEKSTKPKPDLVDKPRTEVNKPPKKPREGKNKPRIAETVTPAPEQAIKNLQPTQIALPEIVKSVVPVVESQPVAAIQEEFVRIVLYPPAPKVKKPKKEPKQKASNSDSSSTSTSSSEEEEKPSNNQPQQLVINIRKNELEAFRQRGILPLKHMSPKFLRAIFHCRLCSFHISSISEVYRHCKDDRHVKLQAAEQSRQTASLMPSPTADIAETIGELVLRLYQCSGLTREDLEIRQNAIEELKKLIETNFPGYTIRPYGSFYTELGLKASNVNIGLIRTEQNQAPSAALIIISVLNWLHTAKPLFSRVVEDLNCRVPTIHFHYEPLGINFAMVVESENAFKTSKLLEQYRLIDPRFAFLTVAFRTFARICYLDQPELGSLPPHAFTLMVLFYLQQDRILPVLHQLTKTKDDADSYLSAAEFLKEDWKPRETTLGQLWLGLLKFYAYTFPHSENAVCVRSLEPLLRSSKNWGNRRIAIEDPFHQNVNMGSPLSTTQAFDFFMDCMRNMFHYFWVPQTADGPLFTQLVLPGEGNSGDPCRCTPEEALRRMSLLKKEDIKWDFQPELILRAKRLPVICSVCSVEGHTKQNCPELEVPKIGHFPPPDYAYFALLDTVCLNVFRSFSQRDVDMENRQAIRNQLEHHIRTEYPDAVLTLFGSSCNGFGFADSDLDVCLTFKSNQDGKGLDNVAIVKKLGKLLRRNKFFCDVVPVSSAKVPIVKLRHRHSGLDADISLYNQLGRRNSQLLATYSAIDPRVRILGFMAKLLAKQCDIGDASRGSLSSYAYTLMVLHYLQQVKPPVIPVLQEVMVDGVDKSKYIVEDWDTYFYEDRQNLGRVWPHLGANREPPSTLWLGFLLYYAEHFNYRQQVVCIRQLKPLYRLEKMWTDRPIAIEDPFNLNHNLGSGISFRMGAYIRRVFVTAWIFFHTPVRRLPPNCSSLEEYLFNPKMLIANGPPPNDRGCLICGKVGHKAKECEYRRGGKNRNKDNKTPQRPKADNAQPAANNPAAKPRYNRPQQNRRPPPGFERPSV